MPPIETGPVNRRLSGLTGEGGDASTEKRYQTTARAILGDLKQQLKLAGVNVGALKKVLADGTVIQVSTIMGGLADIDKVKISHPLVHQHAEGGGRQPVEEPSPYLWVGARVMWEKMQNTFLWYDCLGLMVIEPGENGIVTGAGQAWDNLGNNQYIEVIDPDPFGIYTPFDIAAQEARWQLSRPWVPKGRAGLRLAAYDPENGTRKLRFTKHGLRHYDIANHNGQASTGLIQLPHDPDETAAQIAQRLGPPGYDPPVSLWDQVVVLDPDEGGAAPTSQRAADRRLLDLLQQHTGYVGPTMVLPGEYVIKLIAIGNECGYDNPDTPPYPLQGWAEPLRYDDPLFVELEVRVGKVPFTQTQRIEVEIPRYSQYFHSMWPFGDFNNPDFSCPKQFERPNNHVACWWQGAVLADVQNGTISTVKDEYAPTPVFDTQAKYDMDAACGRRIAYDTYCFVQPPYSDVDVPADLATEAHNLLDVLFFPAQSFRDYADVLAAANALPCVSGQLYHYDIATNVFTAIDYIDQWEDVLRRETILLGRGFAKILFGAVLPDGSLCTTFHAGTGDDTNAYPCDPDEVHAALAAMDFDCSAFP